MAVMRSLFFVLTSLAVLLDGLGLLDVLKNLLTKLVETDDGTLGDLNAERAAALHGGHVDDGERLGNTLVAEVEG